VTEYVQPTQVFTTNYLEAGDEPPLYVIRLEALRAALLFHAPEDHTTPLDVIGTADVFYGYLAALDGDAVAPRPADA